MKLIDRYVVKQFIQTILFGLLAFTLIFLVADMIENLDDFIDQNVPGKIIFLYYLTFSPEIVKLMLPVSVLFASLFTTGKMGNLNEITAIKASGVSLYRFMAPILITTFLLSGVAIYFSGYVVPLANKRKLKIEQEYLQRGYSFGGSNIFFQDSPTRVVTIAYFDDNTNNATTCTVQEYNPADLTKMTVRYDMKRMQYDSTAKNWKAYDGSRREFHGIHDTVQYFRETVLAGVNFLPADLLIKQQKPEEMNLEELRRLITSKASSGNDPRNVQIEYYSRYAFAVTAFVVVLFGLPFSVNKRKGGLALQVGINILITFIYLVFMKVIQAFGKNGAMDPLLTAWLVNIVFLAGAAINLVRVKQ